MSFDAPALQQFLHQEIPLSAAMELTVTALDASAIELSGTLAANHNDKGTAFGGSLAALLTLSGWALLFNRLKAVNADIVIHQQQFTYHQPVTADFASHCELPGDDQMNSFLVQLQQRGRARLELVARIGPAERPAATMTARYVALMRKTDDETL